MGFEFIDHFLTLRGESVDAWQGQNLALTKLSVCIFKAMPMLDDTLVFEQPSHRSLDIFDDWGIFLWE